MPGTCSITSSAPCWSSEALLSDRTPRHPMAPGGLPGADLAGQDPAAVYAEASAAALTAARAGDTLTRVHTTPLGDMPGPALAGFTTLDILVHGWDLAQATGQPATLDDTLAAHVLAFAEQAITPGFRAPRIGPAVPVAADAPLTDRLVAFLGRQPRTPRGPQGARRTTPPDHPAARLARCPLGR